MGMMVTADLIFGVKAPEDWEYQDTYDYLKAENPGMDYDKIMELMNTLPFEIEITGWADEPEIILRPIGFSSININLGDICAVDEITTNGKVVPEEYISFIRSLGIKDDPKWYLGLYYSY